MSPAQVAELERGHHAVGAHGHDHHPFAALDPVAKVADMQRGAAVLHELCGRPPRIISYPYGSASAVTPQVAQAARQLGFSVAFTMERALNRGLREPLLLARVDTNDAPGGRLPLIEIERGEPVALDGMGAARARYFDEGQVLARA
jgi:peptidoglycan/xylan/chitin deacetylase (PgdA/CDA1 family)